MYCKNCGYKMDKLADICVKCGVAKGKGSKFCNRCGNRFTTKQKKCNLCKKKNSNNSVLITGLSFSSVIFGLLTFFPHFSAILGVSCAIVGFIFGAIAIYNHSKYIRIAQVGVTISTISLVICFFAIILIIFKR